MALKNRSEYNAYMAQYMLERYHSRRATALVLLGNKCVACDSEENLEFDHKDRASKSFNIAAIWSYSQGKFLSELEKCQLLCHTCHVEKTTAEDPRVITHGKYWAAYKQKCSCEDCTQFKQAYNLQRRRQRAGVTERPKGPVF